MPGSPFALLETIGRRSGLGRTTPVADGLEGDIFWTVSEYGKDSAYVKNLVANPRVRVRINGVWRQGAALLAPDEPPEDHLQNIDPRTASEIRRLGNHLVCVRIDLEPISTSPMPSP